MFSVSFYSKSLPETNSSMAWLRCWLLQILVISVLNTHSSCSEMNAVFHVQPAGVVEQAAHNVTVNLTFSRHACDVRFLSVTIGSRRIVFNWNGSEKLRNLATALSPADVRVGGTSANFLRFDPNVRPGSPDKFYSVRNVHAFTVTGRQWDLFVAFLTKVGWDLLFDFNNFLWTKDGLWNPSNADLFLNYSSARGVRIPYFQLGNEPSSYKQNFNITIPPEVLLQDYRILKNLNSKYPLYDVSNVAKSWKARDYLQKFVAAGACDVDEISIHQYYRAGFRSRIEDFLSLSTLNSLKYHFEVALKISKFSPHPRPISLTETSSCSGGGAAGLSDRYVAGFLWLDKLGVSAQYGVTRVYRQTLLGGSYGLISTKFSPNPDFYLSVLYKRLIEGPVFSLIMNPPNAQVRMYAHCARPGLYSHGALVVYYLNLEKSKTVLSLAQFPGYDIHLYQLTPGDGSGLTSRYVKLNGQLLIMSGTELPSLPPILHQGDITIDALSFGFIVVPHANVTLCVDHFGKDPMRVHAGPL